MFMYKIPDYMKSSSNRTDQLPQNIVLNHFKFQEDELAEKVKVAPILVEPEKLEVSRNS